MKFTIIARGPELPPDIAERLGFVPQMAWIIATFDRLDGLENYLEKERGSLPADAYLRTEAVAEFEDEISGVFPISQWFDGSRGREYWEREINLRIQRRYNRRRPGRRN